MSTIINTPQRTDDSSSSLGLLIGIIFAIAIISLFFFYAVPAIRNNTIPASQQPSQSSTLDVNVKLPASSEGKTTQTSQPQ
ncbi:MAG: hypothetical protein Q7K40_04400 [bacterium]|nr:hypothetical protein [bacterium]